MSKMDISEKFTRWIKFLFGLTTAMANLNGSPSDSFRVERGVRQGCSLAPYLFLIVGEALTYLMTKTVLEGRLRRITLQEDKKTRKHLAICG